MWVRLVRRLLVLCGFRWWGVFDLVCWLVYFSDFDEVLVLVFFMERFWIYLFVGFEGWLCVF